CGAPRSGPRLSFSVSLTSAPPPLEVKVRRERTLQRVDRLRKDTPLIGVEDALLQAELHGAVVVVTRLLVEQHPGVLVAVALVGRGLVKGQVDEVGDQCLADVEPSSQRAGMDLVADRL